MYDEFVELFLLKQPVALRWKEMGYVTEASHEMLVLLGVIRKEWNNYKISNEEMEHLKSDINKFIDSLV